jgi:hypothetical protein
MKHAVVTTFHPKGYEEYGKKCIASFLKLWPKSVTLYVITENVTVDYMADNLVVIDQKFLSPALMEFKNKYKNNPNATGQSPHNSDKGYLWDAVRFSNKVFAVTAMARKLKGHVDHLIWLDADTVTHSPVTAEFLDYIAPHGNELTAYLNRPIYPECGWVGYNMQHPEIQNFMNRFEQVYTSGEFLTWIESHDSYVFWKVMEEFERKGAAWKALGDPTNRGHVFINSELGAFMDHLKGPRKALGKSKPGDLIKNRTEAWWQGLKK